MPILHTERGNVRLSDREMELYQLLARDRTRTYTMEQLAREMRHGSIAHVGRVARSLRAAIEQDTGLLMPDAVLGVGYRLEKPYERRPPHGTS